jgi:uncharacterized protein (DUF58 family)
MTNQYLSEELIAKIDKFKLKARLIVEGFMIGLHKSPYHGFSVEFSDHRQYNPGDSIKDVDWKVFGKTNRYYIRRYEEETNLKSYILIDHSKSMGYTSGNTTKLEYAKSLASSLFYLMINQQDASGLLSFTDKITSYIPPRAVRSYLNILLTEIYNLQAEDRTRTAEVLHQLAERIHKRGLIILISDLIDEPDEILSGLQHFRHKKNEVVVFHIQDKQEYQFDFQHETEFIDSETGEKLTVNPWQIKKDYLEEYNSNIEYLKKRCFEARIEYNPITTETAYDQILLQYLLKRAKLM